MVAVIEGVDDPDANDDVGSNEADGPTCRGHRCSFKPQPNHINN